MDNVEIYIPGAIPERECMFSEIGLVRLAENYFIEVNKTARPYTFSKAQQISPKELEQGFLSAEVFSDK